MNASHPLLDISLHTPMMQQYLGTDFIQLIYKFLNKVH